MQQSTVGTRFSRGTAELPLPPTASAEELCLLFSEAEAARVERAQPAYSGWSSMDTKDGFKHAGRSVPSLFRVPYEVRPAPGKGLGAFSSARVGKGALVYGGTPAEVAQTYFAVPRSY